MRVVYLDTNHISRLARHPKDPPCRAVRAMLTAHGCHLALNWLHLQELSAPDFRSRSSVGELLDQVDVAWAPAPDVVFDREIRWGIERALYGDEPEKQVFSTSFEHAMGAPPEANIPISEMLAAMAQRHHLRAHLCHAASHGARRDSEFKRAAAVVRNPEEPILTHIRELNISTTRSGLVLTQPFSPDDILARAGGIAGFPAINVAHSLARTRLKDERYRTVANDIMDEWHACYAPYCVAIALDRATAARLRATRLPVARKVTHTLDQLPAIVSRTSA